MKKHNKSRQEEAVALYTKGFSQSEIAQILGVHQSTVSRYFNNPTSYEVEDFYENKAYGARLYDDGTKVYFNRRYRDLDQIDVTEKKEIKVEYYYNDGTFWPDRFYHSLNRIPVYDSEESFKEFLKKQKEKRLKSKKLWGLC